MKKVILSLGLAIATFATVQAQEQTPQQPQQEQQEIQDIKGEGIEQIETSAIPQEVNDGMQNSEYQAATVEQAYKLSGTALAQILGQESFSTYSSNTVPETLYLLRVTHEDSHAALYFTEDGELYASEDMDM